MTRQLVVLAALRQLEAEAVAEALDGKYRLSEFALPAGGGAAVLFVPIALAPALKAWLAEHVGPVVSTDKTYVNAEDN